MISFRVLVENFYNIGQIGQHFKKYWKKIYKNTAGMRRMILSERLSISLFIDAYFWLEETKPSWQDYISYNSSSPEVLEDTSHEPE